MVSGEPEPDEGEKDPETFFSDLGLGLRIEARNLHAEYMATGEPGRATFFVEDRTYHCVDLLRGGAVLAPHYGVGETAEEALARARSRFLSEQR